jgi:hypothetical protein
LETVPSDCTLVRVFHPIAQNDPDRDGSGSYHVAIPVASERRTLHAAGEPHLMRICQFTSRVAVGA